MCVYKRIYDLCIIYTYIVILFLEMYTLSCQLCLFIRGVSHLKPMHFPSAHGTGRATNAEYFMERTSKSPDKCPRDKVTDKNNCEVGKSRGVYIYICIHI